MAVYTVNTTVPQDTALDYLLIKENGLRAARNLDPLTKPQFVDVIFEQKFLELTRQAANARMSDRVQAYQAAAPEAVVAADTALGVS
jgi:hypothetical protein